MAISKVGDLNSLYNLIYDDSLATLYEENIMVSNGLVTYRESEGYAARKVAEWNRSTVAKKPEGEDFANPATRSKTLAATFTPEVSFSQFLLTDEMVQTESQDDIVADARRDLGAGLAEDIDKNLLADFANFSAGLGGAGTTLTYGHVGAALAILQANKIRGMANVALHPFQWHYIWKELGRPAAEYAFLGDTATEALRNYFKSNLLGALWFTSANIAINGSADAIGGVFTQEALMYDQREGLNIEPERDASRKADELNASIGYAHGVLRNAAGVKLTGDATQPTS